MTFNELKEKFPKLRPVRGAPPLFTLNGCGLTIYGRRDVDRETNTYVCTYYVCFIFIPIIPICSYRVADAGGGGWYFLGREPLSPIAKGINILLLCGVLYGLGLSAWRSHYESPEYLAGVKFQEAQDLEAAGKLKDAAERYAAVMNGKTSHSPAAVQRFIDLAVRDMAEGAPMEAASIIQIVIKSSVRPADRNTIRDAALKRVAALNDSSPADALLLLDATKPLAEAASFAALRENTLERVVKADPLNVQAASDLAAIYETKKDLAGCERILTPVADKLKDTEGARILGEIFASNGNHDDAFKLLSPYTESRLKAFHAAENAYQAAQKSAYDRQLNYLRQGRAPAQFYREYERLSEEKKAEKVDEYIESHMASDQELKKRREEYIEKCRVVGPALDLAITRLHRAQKMQAPAERKTELEAAEKLFLAIKGAAGQSDSFRLFYGQVSYWLGKHAEGKKLFDEFLAAKNRDVEALSSVGRLLREVGASSEMRALVEEAYAKTTDVNVKQRIAGQRAAAATDLDDQIKWLGLCDGNEVSVKAYLERCKGDKAMRDGNRELAISHLRKSTSLYEGMPKNESTLNNGALVAFSLFHATQKREDFQKGLEMIAGSVALAPTETVAINNYTGALIKDAVIGAVALSEETHGFDVDYDTDLLMDISVDEASFQEHVKRFKLQPSYTKALSNLDRLLVLSPQDPEVYQELGGLYGVVANVDGLRSLRARLMGITLSTEQEEQAQRYFRGERDAEIMQGSTTVNQQTEKAIAAMPKTGRVRALAGATLVGSILRAAVTGAKVDVEKLVAVSEEAYRAEPIAAAHRARVNALMERALVTLSAKEPRLAALRTQIQRTITSPNALAYAVATDEGLRAAILAHPDVKRALELAKVRGALWPTRRWNWEWPLFNATDPAEAAKVAAAMNTELDVAGNALGLLTAPNSGQAAMEDYFYQLSKGNEAAGRKTIEAFAKRGVPMPLK